MYDIYSNLKTSVKNIEVIHANFKEISEFPNQITSYSFSEISIPQTVNYGAHP